MILAFHMSKHHECSACRMMKSSPKNHRRLRSSLVLIHSVEHRYGEFLKSLVQQVYEDPKLFINVPFGLELVKRFRPVMVVLDVGHDVDSALKTCASLAKTLVFIVGHKPSDRVGYPERIRYFWKPLEVSSFVKSIYEGLLENYSQKAREASVRSPQEPLLIGSSPSISGVRHDIERAARTDLNVLISGDTGTGKGVAAQSMHNNSHRRLNQYLEVNCANVPATLLESELFGYRKGAFTGAWKDKPGKFQIVNDGTIFLDEISEMQPSMQAKLLQVLQEGEFTPVGGVESVKVNVRVIAATNAVLKKIMENGRFRQDLYYRLAVISLYLPPLRERREDIPLLVHYFLEKYTAIYRNEPRVLSERLWSLLEGYDWPGNVRELENMIKSLVALDNEKMVVDDLQKKVRQVSPFLKDCSADYFHSLSTKNMSLKQITSMVASEAEKEIIVQALKEAEGRKKLAAQMLGVSYKCLLNKVKDYEL